MWHIRVAFPGVKALQNVDFTLKKGEIHALMGEKFGWKIHSDQGSHLCGRSLKQERS